MTDSTGFFGTSTDVRYYTQEPIHQFFKDIYRNGYVDGSGNELVVTQHSTGDMSVDVGTGEAWIQGCHYLTDAVVNVELTAADAGLPRVDRIVLRNTITGTRKIEAVAITGTAAVSPVAPAYTRTGDTYDIVLADVAVAAGTTAILTANITSQRDDDTFCGNSRPLFVPISGLVPIANLDMNSYNITNSADPTAGGDGVTVKYRSSVAFTPTPTGATIWFAGATIPTGYLECNGQAVSRTTYPGLFSALGTTYGSGDGSTTFNLPDVQGRTIFGYNSSDASFNTIGETGGSNTHQLTITEMPAHVHSGVVTDATYHTPTTYSVNQRNELKAATSTGSTGSDTAHSNVQPYVTLKLIVRGV